MGMLSRLRPGAGPNPGRGVGLIPIVGFVVLFGCSGSNAPKDVTFQPDDPKPPGGGSSASLPTRIRRLSGVEIDAAISDLLAESVSLSAKMAPDIRQSGFTTNADQAVDSLLASQLETASSEQAEATVDRLLKATPCAANAADEACATTIIAAFAERAWRRPVTDDERVDLLALYRSGKEGGTFRDGISLVFTGVMQSASFLYVTELGDDAVKGSTVSLTQHEIATSIALAVSGGPPDDDLRSAAADGSLDDAAERRRHAERLWDKPAARGQMVRMVQEWLHLDRIASLGKNNTVYPKFDGLRSAMQEESRNFVGSVLFDGNADLSELISADYTLASAPLATFYGGETLDGKTSLANTTRRGILNQAAFLAVHGEDQESAPVVRGATVLRQLLCVHLATPAELQLNVVPPDPDPRKTTRERFSVHATESSCSSCHKPIDALGFSFEGFDGMGDKRTTENGKPVQTDSVLDGLGETIDGPVKDSAELAMRLGSAPEVQDCFARNLFRFETAQSIDGTDDAFADAIAKLSPADRANIKTLLLSYITDKQFILRKRP
jgi:Protein of unknown function (DUF1592)/Protein of unknown function (DUF1588)/Protein of unknown function (DUF1595)/Protein of unknown function (DUF1587)